MNRDRKREVRCATWPAPPAAICLCSGTDHCDSGVSAECATIFRKSDPIFAGHFPGNPLVPGVIITEALAQTAGIAAAAGYPQLPKAKKQRIVLRAEKIAEMGELLQFRVNAVVNGKYVSEGELVLTKAASSD